MTVPCGRSARSARCRLSTWARVWNTNSAPRPPAPCQQALACRQAVVLGQRLEAEAPGDAAAPGGGLGDQHLRAGAAREERGQEPDGAGAPDHDRTPLDAGAEPERPAPQRLGVGMQDAVGADRPHLGDEDAEHRIEVGGSGTSSSCAGLAVCPLLCPKVSATKSPGTKPAAAAATTRRPPCSRGTAPESAPTARRPRRRRGPRPSARAGRGWWPSGR